MLNGYKEFDCPRKNRRQIRTLWKSVEKRFDASSYYELKGPQAKEINKKKYWLNEK